MRRTVAALVMAGAAAGCGGSSPPPAPRTAVQLTIDAPGDQSVTRARSVEVRGRVRPAGARVLVRGRRVAVSGGAFATTVALDAGTNVIDVLAGARGERAAVTAVRVRREVKVEVPDVRGDAPDDAAERLAGLGLKADVQESGGLFDRLLPGDASVCETDPAVGDTVDPGTTVRLLVAKGC